MRYQDSKARQKSEQVLDSQWATDTAYEAKNIQAFAKAKAEITNHLVSSFYMYQVTFYMVNRCSPRTSLHMCQKVITYPDAYMCMWLLLWQEEESMCHYLMNRYNSADILLNSDQQKNIMAPQTARGLIDRASISCSKLVC